MQVMPKFLAMFGVIAMMSFAHAEKDKGARRDAFKACAEEQGIIREEGKRLSKEDRKKINSCMEIKGFKREDMKEGRKKRKGLKKAKKECAEENNLKKPEKGNRPSEQERELMNSCLEKKGFKRPSKE